MPLFPNRHAIEILAVGKFTGGRCPDLLARDRTSGEVLLRSGSEQPTIRPWRSAIPLAADAALHPGDLDRDGFDDVLIADSPRLLIVGYSNGIDAFSREASIPVSGRTFAEPWAVIGGEPHAPLKLAIFDATPVGTQTVHFGALRGTRIQLDPSPISAPLLGGFIGMIVDGKQPDGTSDALFRHQHSPHLYFALNFTGGYRLWTELPSSGSWSHPMVGDLNGDLRSDLLVYGGTFVGWWMAFGSEGRGLIRGARGIPFVESDRLMLADIDCDGADDILSRSFDGTAAPVAFSRLSAGIEGVEIRTRGKTIALTSSSGRAAIAGDEVDDRKIHGRLDRYTVQRSGVRVERRAGTLRHTIVLMAVREPTSPSDKQGSDSPSKIQSGAPFGTGRRYTLGATPPGPYVCLGFNPVGSSSQWSAIDSECPKDHAVVATSIPKDAPHLASNGVSVWQCCPLPYPNMLTETKEEAASICPEGFVVTGLSPGWSCRECRQHLICSRLDPRYRLSAPYSGTHWGVGRFGESSKHQVMLSDVPVALRYALGRISLEFRFADGCVGYPWGAVLTGVSGDRSCDGVEFREIFYASEVDGHSVGSSVRMFPECRELDDPNSPLSGCVR